MERKVTRLVQLAVTFVTAALLCGPLRADDYGPQADVRAIRHDLPIVLSSKDAVTVDDVVVNGNEAVAQLHKRNQFSYIEVLERKYDKWWAKGTYQPCDQAIPPELLATANQHIPMLIAELQRATPTPRPLASGLYKPSYDCAIYRTDIISFSALLVVTGGGYELRIAMGKNDASSDAQIEQASGRIPTESESWMGASGNSYYFFAGDVISLAPIHVQNGTSVDVWFPFVLNPAQRYSLTIAHADKPIGPIDGVLKDNTLHFVLPAFSIKPEAHLMGEIDSD